MVSTKKSEIQVLIYENYNRLCDELVRKILGISKKAIRENGLFNMALAGGATPKGLYLRMSDSTYRNEFQWPQMHFFWGDERWVSPDHLRSNYRMAAEALLTKVDLPVENIHHIITKEGDPDASADRYERELMLHFGLREGEFPKFDLMLLGLGQDGHIASLFPGDSALHELKHLVLPVIDQDLEEPRVTLTLPVINYANHIIFMASGIEKSHAVQMVLEPEEGSPVLPAQMIYPEHGTLAWYVDRSAASNLKKIQK